MKTKSVGKNYSEKCLDYILNLGGNMQVYEDLTPDQLIYIVQLVSGVTIFYTIVYLLRTILTLKISNNVKSLELMIEKKISEGIVKPTFFEHVKNWWSKRKEKKIDPMDKYLPKADPKVR